MVGICHLCAPQSTENPPCAAGFFRDFNAFDVVMVLPGRVTHPSRDHVRDRLTQLLCEIAKIPPEAISEKATVDEQLRMESVAFIEIQVALEDEYDIELDPVEIIELNEFGAIVDHVHAHANRIRGARGQPSET